jgi:Arc/MetJ-type ribon-helix-helix transcriptional regulator
MPWRQDAPLEGPADPSAGPASNGDARQTTARYTICILICMTTPVPTRFTDEELALIDDLVDAGIGESRSAVIRRGVHHLAEAVRRARVGATIAQSYLERPQTPDDDELAMASANAMTEAEPW